MFRAAVPLLLLTAAFSPVVASAQGVEPNRTPLRTTLAELTTLRSAYVDAFNKKDDKAVAALYTDNAIQIQADGSVLTGGAAIRQAMAGEAANWPHAVIKSDTVYVYGSTAVDVGTWTQHPKEGGENVTRYISVLRKDMRGWKLANVVLVPTKPLPATEAKQ
jgi:uncharacterized protein (TIGR02246 family)